MHRPIPSVPALLSVLIAGGALVLDPGGWQVFGPVKWLVITSSAFAAGAAAVARGVDLHRPSAVGWGALLVWAIVTSITAVDPLAAWLGTPDRRFGFVALVTMAAAFAGGQAVGNEDGRRLLARTAVVALIGMAGYAVAEVLDLVPIDLTTTTTRIGSTFGSPAYLGAALCLLMPLTVGVSAERREPVGWRAAAAVAAGGGLVLLAGSGTRAAAVGLGAASLLLVPRWFSSLRRRPGISAGIALVLLGVIVVSPLADRFGEPVNGRLAEWRTASRVLISHPTTGTGLEGYRVVFPAHVDIAYVQDHGRATVTDRAHSGPLDLGVALGVPGALAWAAGATWLVMRGYRAARGGDAILAGMGAGLVALLVQELFLFPTVEVGVGAWAVAGSVVAATSTGRALRVRTRSGATLLGGLAAVAVLAGILDIVADHRAAEAVTKGRLVAADAAFALRPDSFRYGLLAADVAFRNGDVTGAGRRIEAAAAVSPRDPAVRLALARVVATGAADDALGVLEEAVREDPNHPELRILLGDVLAERGRAGEAERSWLAASHLAPRDPTPHLRLAALYLAAGEVDLARESLEAARRIDPDHAAITDFEDTLR